MHKTQEEHIHRTQGEHIDRTQEEHIHRTQEAADLHIEMDASFLTFPKWSCFHPIVDLALWEDVGLPVDL